MSDEEWLKAAVADDSLVVQLLLRLSHSSPPPALLLDWTVRQPRSKSIALKSATARASPTTPLSWSASTSNSGGAIDGFEESSRPPPGSKGKPVTFLERMKSENINVEGLVTFFSLFLSPLFSSPAQKPLLRFASESFSSHAFNLKRPRHPSAEGYFWKCEVHELTVHDTVWTGSGIGYFVTLF